MEHLSDCTNDRVGSSNVGSIVPKVAPGMVPRVVRSIYRRRKPHSSQTSTVPKMEVDIAQYKNECRNSMGRLPQLLGNSVRAQIYLWISENSV